MPRPPRNRLHTAPGTVVPVAMMPIVAAIGFMPGVARICAMPLPPLFIVETQPHMRKMHTGIGVPAIAESIAHDIRGCTDGRAGQAAESEGGGQEKLFDGFHR